MRENRADKGVIRGLWVDAVAQAARAANETEVPLYLTLAGALGLDIERLIDAGLVKRAENRAIAAKDQWKIVAVESNSSARLALKERFTGLRVLSDDLQAMLHSTGPFTWPRGEKVKYCRARVVNLDLNCSLEIDHDESGACVVPIVQMVAKLAELHLKPPALDWMLCLTICADIHWSPEACAQVQEFLRENFQAEHKFAAGGRQVLGHSLFDQILAHETVDFTRLSPGEQQALLMVFVPKRIVTDVFHKGWKITTSHNLRYGGPARSGRMVTWLMRFAQNASAKSRPRASYSESLNLTLEQAGVVSASGEVRAV